MNAEQDNKREMTVAELEAALQELESGEELTLFAEGHGLQSRLFVFAWREPQLDIDIRLPYARVLNDEETQAADNAEIGAALRMARLLLLVAANDALLQEGEAALFVSLDEDSARYRVVDAEGATRDEGNDWSGLTARLEAALPRDAENVSIIWP